MLSRRNALVLAFIASAFAATWASIVHDSGPGRETIERLLRHALDGGAPALRPDGVVTRVSGAEVATVASAICRRDRRAAAESGAFDCAVSFALQDGGGHAAAFGAVAESGAPAIDGYDVRGWTAAEQLPILREFGFVK
ncbi:MAG: hypothetical protein IPL47_09330 [Phyllobacteriaceae bacterium]|nr:hypothetical protein [Phyllobacteriaceae bacterium]